MEKETAELSSSVETSEGFANLRGECGGNLPLGELFGAPASCSGWEETKVSGSWRFLESPFEFYWEG